ncbi:replicative DNA helicase [Radicibacter daui]|uniref:replicative DNA helicase n=1 Tax=Radicibacter daui TaxID=3064829 RepID=UPI004046FB20
MDHGHPTGNLIPMGGEAGNPGYRQQPFNDEAEKGLLGALLTNNRAYEKVSEFLRADHFYDPLHGRIFDAVVRMIDRNQIADPVTLKNFFEADPDLREVGGTVYLADLASSVIGVMNVQDYGQTIFDLAMRRKLIDLGEEMVNESYRPDIEITAVQQIEKAEQQLYDLATTGDFKGDFTPFNIALGTAISHAEAAFKRDSHIAGCTTGLRDLDNKLGGLHPSDLLILAGRPSMGKTALATNIAFNAAKAYVDSGGREGAPVAFFSLEMSAEQLAGRILSERAEIPSENIRRGDLRDADFLKMVQVSNELQRLPLFIDDTPALSITAVRTRARRLKRQSGLGLLVVDYLQLLSGTVGGGSENRVQEVSQITRGLKAIAKELEIPVLALSQLSRQVEQREDKRPQLADLRESGSIEQDADVVMFVYREQYYLERAEPGRRPDESEEKFNDRYEQWKTRLSEVYNTGEAIIAKQRHGPVGSVRMFFDGQFTRFGDLDHQHQDDHGD